MRMVCKRQILKLSMTAISAILLVLISAFAVSGTVLSQSSSNSKEQKEYYKTLEHEYIDSMRDFLEEQGYVDSGITMNRVIDEDGSMAYTVMIHHRRISALDSLQRDELTLSCREVKFPIEGCSLCYTFLETSF